MGASSAAKNPIAGCPIADRKTCANFSALLSVYDKTGLLPFAKNLKELGFRLLGSGGTAKLIRENGIEIE